MIKMPIVARRVVELPVRRLSGVINSAVVAPSEDKRTGRTYDYLNIGVLVDQSKWTEQEQNAAEGWNGIVKISVNANLSKFTDLGRLLQRLGIPIPAEKQSFDEKTLEGMKISFDMVREGNFTNPVLSSVSRDE